LVEQEDFAVAVRRLSLSHWEVDRQETKQWRRFRRNRDTRSPQNIGVNATAPIAILARMNVVHRPSATCQNGRIEKTSENLEENNKSLHYALLRELTKLKFEFFGRVDSLLNKKRIHGVHGRSKTILARKFINRLFVADEVGTSISALCGATN
jgi:hypothetical protein